jgi:hypothetical protein
MSNRTTIRLTASADAVDAIGQLERAVKLARELEDIGFVVTLSGDIYIDARMDVEPEEPE